MSKAYRDCTKISQLETFFWFQILAGSWEQYSSGWIC